jgi:hypothetical protein
MLNEFYSSGSQPSTVDDKDVAIDKTGSVRGEKDDRTEKVLQLAHPLHGNTARYPIPFYGIFKLFFTDRRQSKNRRKTVAVDAFRSPFDGKGTGQLVHGSTDYCQQSYQPGSTLYQELDLYPVEYIAG